MPRSADVRAALEDCPLHRLDLVATRPAPIRSRARDYLGWIVAGVLLLLLVAGTAFVMGRWTSLREGRSGWRAPTPSEWPRAPAPVSPPTTEPTEVPRSFVSPPQTRAARGTTMVDAGSRPSTPDSGPDGGPTGGTELDATPEAVEAAPPTPPEEPPRYTEPVPCGPFWCPLGQICCNARCGLCAYPGVKCSQRDCGQVSTPTSLRCGMNTCDVGF